jgi:hypothetical protein
MHGNLLIPNFFFRENLGKAAERDSSLLESGVRLADRLPAAQGGPGNRGGASGNKTQADTGIENLQRGGRQQLLESLPL